MVVVLAGALVVQVGRQIAVDASWGFALIAAAALGGAMVVVWRASTDRSRVDRMVVASAHVLAIAIATASIPRALRAPEPSPNEQQREEATFVSQVVQRSPHDGDVFLEWTATDNVSEIPQLLALALEQRGQHVTVAPAAASLFGPELVGTRTGHALRLQTVSSSPPPQGATLLASYGPYTVWLLPPPPR
jgi:hypothetical protein